LFVGIKKLTKTLSWLTRSSCRSSGFESAADMPAIQYWYTAATDWHSANQQPPGNSLTISLCRY